MGMTSYRQSGVEADDLIATLNKVWNRESSHRTVVVSGDKDLMGFGRWQYSALGHDERPALHPP